MIFLQNADIKSIIFDLGGVLLNIDPSKSLYKTAELTGKPITHIQNLFAQSNIFGLYDCGKISDIQFRAEICNIMDMELSDAEVDSSWNSILLDFPPHRVKLLDNLRSKYRIFLLSNTNSIHYKEYCKTFKNLYNRNFADLFDRLFLSFEMKMHKPDIEIYEKVLQDEGLIAEECLFIDDTYENIESALKLGIKAIHLASDRDVTELFTSNNTLNP